MFDSFSYLMLAATFGLLSFSVPMLFVRKGLSQVYIVLGLFLVCGALANMLPLLIEFYPGLQQYSLAIVVPAYIAQPVCLWMYVKGLCSPTRWRLRDTHKGHLILPVIAIIYSLVALLVPENEMTILLEGSAQPQSGIGVGIMVATFSLMLIWIGQSGVYIALIVKRLVSYRRELKQLFASNDQLEMNWLLGVIGVIALAWCGAFTFLVMSFLGQENELDANLLSTSYFALVWVLSFWGLRQKPGFHNRYLSNTSTALSQVVEAAGSPQNAKKYSRSGLDDEMCKKIAKDIETAMQTRELFLDPTLNLSMLAAEVNSQPNYVSQALNQILGRTFFDYVNRWRVGHSQTLIKLAEAPVLDIALMSGFNSKSSFYTAFRKETGQTPTEYRLRA